MSVERPGIDYTLKGCIPSKATMQRFADDKLIECEVGTEWYQLSYQTCRFCKRGLGEIKKLLKYGVRHYACEGCVAHYAKRSRLTVSR